jgi:two-component system NarL family sensor kinase
LKLFTKLFFTHTTIALVSVASLSILFYVLFREALIQRTIDQLSSVNILKKNHIDDYFRDTKHALSLHFDKNKPINIDELERAKRIYGFTSVAVTDRNFQKAICTSDSSLLKVLDCILPSQAKGFQAMEITSCIKSNSTAIVYKLTLDESVVLFQENFEKIQNILMETTGMGNTGESYFIGPDFKLRSKSRFIPAVALQLQVDSLATKQILNSGVGDVIQDYRGVKVLSMNRIISFEGLQWILISEIDFDEALEPLIRWRNYIIVSALIIAILIVGITFLTSRSISQPILSLKEIIGNLSKGIIKEENTDSTDFSEVGQMSKAIQELSTGLARTTQFANEIGRGKFDIAYSLLSEQDSLGLALINMRDKLKTLTDDQVKLVREKTSAILEGQENERKRIVQELHDGIGQLLTGIRLRVQMLNESDPSRNEIMELINETIAEVKRISYNVMPNAIVDFGLEAALKGLCENARKASKLSVDFKYVKEVDQRLSFETSIGVFRIVQEGFNNIMKHSGASEVDLHVLADEHELYFLLKDNGQGFDTVATKPSPGIGLYSMKERAQLLDGSLEIYSSTEGTTVEGRIPIKTTLTQA